MCGHGPELTIYCVQEPISRNCSKLRFKSMALARAIVWSAISKTGGQRDNYRKSAHATFDKVTNPGGKQPPPSETTNNEDSVLKITNLDSRK